MDSRLAALCDRGAIELMDCDELLPGVEKLEKKLGL